MRTAGGGCNLEAEFRQKGDGNRADAAGGARDQDFTIAGFYPLLFQCHDAEHGGVTGNAHGHGISRAPVFGHGHQPITGNAGHFRKAAMVLFANTPAIENDPVAGLPVPVGGFRHGSGEIDTGDQREFADDGGLAGDCQAILVIHRGVADGNGDVAFHEIGFSQLNELNLLALIGLGNLDGTESIGHGPSFSAGKASRNLTGCPPALPKI